MKVYALFLMNGMLDDAYDPLGHTLIGVFSSQKQAEKNLKSIAKKKKAQTRWSKIVVEKDVVLCLDKNDNDYVEEYYYKEWELDKLRIPLYLQS